MKEKNVIDFYIICHKLKNIIRTGWKTWGISAERLESVAEHIYGTQMLALSVVSEYNYNVDIMKLLYMIAIHELGETIIGDYTPFQITKEEKEKIEHEAVHNILKSLIDGNKIEEIYLEFESRKTEEAKLAYQCDKFECDIQAKIYDELGYADITSQRDNDLVKVESVAKQIDSNSSLSDAWIKYDLEHINYDQNFKNMCNYIINNNITEKE